MDQTDKVQAETVFATNYPTKPPPDNCTAFRPADNDDLLIQPKKLPNPILESKSHRVMQRELKLNNKMGIDVLHQKSELSKVFQDRQRDQFHQQQTKDLPKKTEFELMLEKRKKGAEEAEEKEAADLATPEFIKMKEKLRKA